MRVGHVGLATVQGDEEVEHLRHLHVAEDEPARGLLERAV